MIRERKYLSDLMKSREVFELNLDVGVIKLIVGGTGIGKSQFVIGKFIKKTYHSFANMSEYSLNTYDTIICDEAHFIIQDGTFNDKCDLIFKRLMELYKNNTNIIMITATEFELLPTLWFNGISEKNGTLVTYDYNKKL